MTLRVLDEPTRPPRKRGWVRRELTLMNLVMVATFVFGVGGYFEANKALERRVAALEQQRLEDRRDADRTYNRQDVLKPTLDAIERRLGAIESSLKNR